MDGVDDGTYHVNLGHSFPYYDKVFTDAWMSSNGVVILYDPANNVGNPNTRNSYCCNGLDIASNPNPYYNYLIAPLWTDLTDRNPDPEAGYYYRTGTEQTSFLWNKVYEYGTNNINTFEAELFKDGSFKFNYGDISITRHSVFIGNTGELSDNPPQFTQQYFGQNLTGNDVQNFGALGTAAVEPIVDCTSPLNDPSCDGYYTAIVPSPPVVNATPAVVNSTLTDINTTLPEPETETLPEPEPTAPLAAAPVPVVVQEAETLPEPEPVVVTVERVGETAEEPTAEPTTETSPTVQKYVTSLIATLTAPVVAPAAMPLTAPALVAEAFAVSTISTTRVDVSQVSEAQETTLVMEQTAKPADVQFEQDFNDAIGAGQSLGQFLSAQLPDFSRFDVKPPSQDEQRTTQRASRAMQNMSQQDIAQSTEAQLEEMQESGGFSDQSLTVLLISNNPNFNQYSNITLDDRSQFYENRVIYRGNAPADNARALLRGSGTRTYEAMVDQQWQR